MAVKFTKWIEAKLVTSQSPDQLSTGPPPPKFDPVFELKQLPDTLKYAYLDEEKIYPVIIVLTFQNMKKKHY